MRHRLLNSIFMGSLPSPQPTAPPPPPSSDFSPARYRVYASFCHKNISNWIECYNPETNTWNQVSPIPGLAGNHVLKDFAIVCLGNSIYLIGGLLCRREMTPCHDEHDEFINVEVKVLGSVLCYNIGLDQWCECAPMNVPRCDFASTTCENRIYVAGGRTNVASARGLSCAEVYDPTHDAWIPLPNMTTLRYKCVGVTWQGKIYVVGGFAARSNWDKPMLFVGERSSADVYDIQARRWNVVEGMWQLDVPPNQIVAVDGRLFSSGDCLQAWKGHIEAYDGKLNIWSVVDGSHLQTLNSPITTSDASTENGPPIQRLYLTMAPIGTHFYFLAGYRIEGQSMGMTSRVHIFDTSATSEQWRSLEPMEEEREKELCGHCCVVQIP